MKNNLNVSVIIPCFNEKETIKEVFEKHGDDCLYITNTRYLSRAIFDAYPEKENILYMQGSMGLAPAIGVGLAMFSSRDVVVLTGDASLLMHLGITHTIRDVAKENLHVYVLDNGCHESVGGQHCSPLEEAYVGVTEIIKISCDGKLPRVGIGFEENARNIVSMFEVD